MTLDEAQALVQRIRDEYDLAPDHEILVAALEDAIETWARIAAEVEEVGLLTEGRWGKVANPLLGPLARARQSVLAAVKALQLPHE